MNTANTHRKLVLFDMDGTLVNVSRWHWTVFVRTMLAVYGFDPTEYYERGVHAGDTQANMIRAVCQRAGLEETLIEKRLPEAVATLAAMAVEVLPADLRAHVLPGVVPLLDALQGGGQALGLVTGALCRTTEAILERTDLWRFFPVRACGDEATERRELVQLAIERARQTYGLGKDEIDVVVLGDAPLDIQAGQAVGAKVVAVATGSHTEQMLADCRPQAVLASLEDWPKALQAILNGH
jgi:phosphoglycolate phosphatase-like HAD superfamily hydrolase